MEKFTIFFKKRIEPFIALAVLIALVVLIFQLIEDNELKKEISQNCGWGEENYRCFCQKSDAMEIMNIINNDVNLEIEEYDKMDG